MDQQNAYECFIEAVLNAASKYGILEFSFEVGDDIFKCNKEKITHYTPMTIVRTGRESFKIHKKDSITVGEFIDFCKKQNQIF